MKLSKKMGAGGIAAAIIGSIFAVEGGWVNNPLDPGGETNHGVTAAVAQQHRQELVSMGWNGKMRDLTQDMAKTIYYKDYIQKPGFDRMLMISPAVAEKLVDAGVNTGTSRSAKWFQDALNSVSRNGKDYLKITSDGKVGPATIQAYQALQRKRGAVVACQMVIKMMDGKQTTHYLSLNMDEFTPGWIINRVGNVPLEACDEDANP
ncbi:endolysin [Achromobacter phage vB_AxyP_19-32_Axy11]|uniref:Uncharacterized protein n=3 Tax=Pourcelvirus TaxID=2842976 RepID=A0A514CVW2_9CAUD|nr:endolysin [Achromobacter phage vB_AxyP_19-32_Axy10]YP_010079438.1 endolysin [Achromobacter phage vB_AxyP_19-32_Axy11]QDH83943.1 hypothetical protein Axy10_068 [Achromobacter phage vB_AxyP_19-32_Axy10]QDH84024.1 hypothetical protein Axy11_067 [Achromobacter phage vB_AxyP_19-32_Axy11]QDH84620.1 hypothetical protein Axy22_064 [Achromobacter phage vB_AxyP_19-32_Axy22]